MGYNLLINGIYWGYNPFANPLLTSWDIQVLKISFISAGCEVSMEQSSTRPISGCYVGLEFEGELYMAGRVKGVWGVPKISVL